MRLPRIELDDDELRENDDTCQHPCDPDVGCPECADYWSRMEAQGFWDRDRHRWTDKGWHEMTK